MGSQERNMAVLGQIVKHIPGKLIEKLKGKYKIQTRAFSATSHVAAMIFAHLSHALSLNDICDSLHFRKGNLAQIRDCVPQAGTCPSASRFCFFTGYLWNFSGS